MPSDVITNTLQIAEYSIMANGTVVSADTLKDVLFIEVEQNLYVPSMAIVRLRHPDLASTHPTTFKIGTELVIKMGQSSSELTEVFNGEIVALEIDASPTGTPTVTARAYDKRHRLMRGRKIQVFLKSKDSDNFSKLAREAGLSASVIATSEIYDWLIQNNETDLEFLTRRALRIGMEVMMDGAILKMRKPPASSGSAAATLTWGEDLLDFKVRVNSTNQVKTVTVRGWDVATKQAIIGTSNKADFMPNIGLGKDGAAIAKDFGSSNNVMYTVYRPVTTQSDANLVAKAIHNDLNGRAVQIQGRCFGNKAIKAGIYLEIKKAGSDYNGKYYVTSCTHRYDMGGFYTYFESNGKNTNTILELTNQFNERGSGGLVGPIVGVVTNIKADDDSIGQIKVKYPILGDAIESDWVRLVSPMAGGTRGILFMPEVDDEVLVAFENGDISRPFMLGAVWNGRAKPPLPGQGNQANGKIKERTIKTVSGHTLTFNDTQDKPGITVIDKTGNNKITIDSTANKIAIESDGDMLLKAKTKMTIEAADLDITVTNKIMQKGGGVAMESSSQNFTVKSAANLEMKANASAKLEGAMMDLKASASAKMDGGAMTEIKGGIIKLN